MAKNHIITGLDIGSSTIKALSAVKKPEQGFEVLGQISLPSFGVRRGVVVKVEEVAKNISQATRQLQEEIGQRIEDVFINIGGSHIFSTPSQGSVIVSRADQKISEEDINRVIQTAQVFPLPFNKEILDIFPQEFIVDGQGQIKDPLDMQGVRLEVKVLAVGAFSPYLKNLTSAVLNAGLRISDITPSSLASARAVLTPQQKELGVCLLDMGAGTTNLAVYQEGDLVYSSVLPIGSSHITNDIAVGLKTDIDIAEQIKKEFGSCLVRKGNKKEKIELSHESGNSEVLIFSHKILGTIIEARVSEIFDLVRKEFKKVPSQDLLPAGVVLTGGGAKLSKIVEFAKKELKLPVRLGLPQDWAGLEKDPISSTVCGLVLGGQEVTGSDRTGSVLPTKAARGMVSKLKRIFKFFLP